MIVTSPLLARVPNLRHGFSTRVGGVSVGPFAGLNLAVNVGDDPGAVAENHRRFVGMLEGAGPPVGLALAEANQVHGVRILDVDGPGRVATDADALATSTPGVAVAVRTADCAPILLAALGEDGLACHVAAVHAGWRGATAGIAAAAVARLVERSGRSAAHVVAAIGPTIGVDDFEVGDEVIAAARASLDGAEPPSRPGPAGRMHLDLVALIAAHLERAGVPREHIEAVGGSTADPARYYSHRRDRGLTGRHLSAIGLAPRPSRQ